MKPILSRQLLVLFALLSIPPIVLSLWINRLTIQQDSPEGCELPADHHKQEREKAALHLTESMSLVAGGGGGGGGGGGDTPYTQCMRSLDPSFDASAATYLHLPNGKNTTMTLREAFESNGTSIYLLHQRKAAGSSLRDILYNMYRDIVGGQVANATSFVPCINPQSCARFELPIYEQNQIGSIKLAAGHLSYHIPWARAIFESQVLITNFREPLARIKSCMLFRYPKPVSQALSSPDFSVDMVEQLLMTKKDMYKSTCLQEPFRILSPFHPDKEPVSQKHVQEICCYVKNYMHLVRAGHAPKKMTSTSKDTSTSTGGELMVAGSSANTANTTTTTTTLTSTTMTAMERELAFLLATGPKSNPTRSKFNALEQDRWNEFESHLRKHNPFVRAELDLYNCVFGSEG